MFVAHMPNDFNGDSWLLNPGEDHWSSHANCKIMSYNKPFDIYYKMAKNVVMTTTGNTFSTNGFQKRYLLAVLKVLVLDSPVY